jgi:NADPH:quinone reductase-like Zn-dependent oxidoreductase
VLYSIVAMALRYQAVKQGGSFEVVPVEVPVPGAGEILIKLKAIALNPVDWKQLLVE